ncbi:MAG: MotA/TolQ/ExbB proton channel family protein [Lentisphaeraceae bacterium]|nr:MotA/TolQ/ExbB proton channel family protein [Lentisphaeraceae bacterium]
MISLYESFWEVMQKSGALMWPIIFCAVISLFIVVERLFHYHRCQINTKDFIQGIFNNLKRSNVVETISICDDTPGPIAHMTRASILRAGQDTRDVEQAIEEVSLSEIPRLEKNLNILATIAHITPLLGLLGTVTGLIKAFHAIGQKASYINLQNLAPYISEAMITTAAGLAVAIPTYAFYNLLVTRVESIVNEMEMAATEIVYFLSHNEVKLDANDEVEEEQTPEYVETEPELVEKDALQD